jgi:predicted glycoside hydrolase/deacetylase ChbG (UPF0249 family)
MRDDLMTGALIVNADDWGQDCATTDRTLECIGRGSISSVSAMVYMTDSERAAAIARESGVDAGLHLNFTAPFSAPDRTGHLAGHHERVRAHLRRHRFAQLVFHPGLVRSFDYVVKAQLDEFQRLYGARPGRIDGHHHMHLCANVVLGSLLPAGTLVRRNFTFRPGEKSAANRLYRSLVDRIVGRRHRTTDYLFTLPPLEPAERLRGIFALARTRTVELEAHPVLPDEYRYLHDGAIFHHLEGLPIARCFDRPAESDRRP